MPKTAKQRQKAKKMINEEGVIPTAEQKGTIAIEHGTVGTDIFSGYIDVDYNTKWRDWGTRVKTVDEMIGSDASVEAVLMAIKNPIMSLKFFIEPVEENGEEKEIADFVHKNIFEEMMGGFDWFLEQALTQYDYGCSVFEIVLKEKANMIMLHKLAFREQKSIDKWAINGMPWAGGHPAGITQMVNMNDDDNSTTTKAIPWNNLLIFSHKRKGNNFEGVSVLRSAYLHWYMKNLLYKIGGVSADRFGVGIPYIKFKQGASKKDISKYEELVKNIKSNQKAFAVFDDKVQEFDILTPKSGGEKGMMKDQIDHHDRKIYDSILAGFLNLTTGEGGSNALSRDQSSFFLRGLQRNVNYICSKMDELIKKLVYLNFGERDKYPCFKASDIGQISMDEYVVSIRNAKEGGLLNWTPRDEDKVREQIKMPALTEDEREEIANRKPIVPPTPPTPGLSEEKRVLSIPRPTERERAFTRNIGDFENYLESEYANFENIVSAAEKKLRSGVALIYESSEMELVDGQRVFSFSKKNREMQKKALDFVNKVQVSLSAKMVNSPIQKRLFEKTKRKAIASVKENKKLLEEIKINDAQFNSFISGHISNVEGILFNEPRRIKEKIILNYGSQVQVALAVKQAKDIAFNRNILKLSTVTHARGAYNAIQYSSAIDQGFTMFKPVVPRQTLKKVSPSGMTSSILFKLLVAAEINRIINNKTNGETTDALTGLNLHHNGFTYFYPIAMEDQEREKEIAEQQRKNFLDNAGAE